MVRRGPTVDRGLPDMAAIKLQEFAEQIGITSSKLLQQLAAAGITGKGADTLLSDEEKVNRQIATVGK